MNKYVFDTSAMLAYIEDESGADIVEDLFVKAMNKKVEIFVSVASVIELYYNYGAKKRNSTRTVGTP